MTLIPRFAVAPILLVAALAAGVVPATAPVHAATTTKTTTKTTTTTHTELVPWDQKGDFAATLARAKKEKKLVFLDFYAVWCGPCKMMDRQTYSDSAVGVAAAKFVNKKIDAEKGEGIELARRYKIDSYPTLVIVDASGTQVNRKSGFYPPPVFRRFLEDTREGRTSVASIEALIAGGKDTYDNRIALGEKAAEAGDWEKARAQVERTLTFKPHNAGGRAADLLLTVASGERASGAHEGAVADYRRYLELFPGTARETEAKTGLAVSLAETGHPDDAFATFKQVVEQKPDDANLQSALARFSAGLKVGLDDGLAAGKRAVELTQGGATAYDALAEIHSARGEWDDAVVASERALEKRPNDNYLRGRLEKFQEGAVANRTPR